MRRILIVDDQTHVRAALVAALRVKGFEIVAAESGVAALQEFKASRFDVAVIDIYMPGLDGINLIKTLRGQAPDFPIVAMSGVMLGGSERTALDYISALPGLSHIECLKKPFRTSELMSAVDKAMAIAA